MREVLHFAHGNGFPSPVYRQLLGYLHTCFDCHYIDRIGHAADFPVTENWPHLVQEIIQSIESQTTQPVIGVGHSLGGILNFLAAMQAPHLFKMLILLDAPLLSPFRSSVLQLSKLFGIVDKITPASKTRKRKAHWHSREEVLSYLKSRKLFKTFSAVCLDDYITYGMIHDESGYSLRFDCEVEYQIYCTVPAVLREQKSTLHIPSALLYGNKSDVVRQSDRRYMKKRYGIMPFKIEGTHMFPLEHPEETARLIIDVVNKFPH